MKTMVGHYPLGGRAQISVCIVHISRPVLMNKDRIRTESSYNN